MALGRLDDLRRPLLERGGEPPLERVRRLDDVVVDRDHGVPDLPGCRVGEEQLVHGCHKVPPLFTVLFCNTRCITNARL
jgi:hypothetical protein